VPAPRKVGFHRPTLLFGLMPTSRAPPELQLKHWWLGRYSYVETFATDDLVWARYVLRPVHRVTLDGIEYKGARRRRNLPRLHGRVRRGSADYGPGRG